MSAKLEVELIALKNGSISENFVIETESEIFSVPVTANILKSLWYLLNNNNCYAIMLRFSGGIWYLV